VTTPAADSAVRGSVLTCVMSVSCPQAIAISS